MNKFMIRLLCCFIPNRQIRHFYRKCCIGRYNISGNNNKIFFLGRRLPKMLKIPGIDIHIKGNDNTVVIGDPQKNFRNCRFIINANNVKYKIGNVHFMHDVLVLSQWGNNQSFYFGDNSDVNGMEVFLMEENTTVKIGINTIMSTNIVIRPTDIHTIIDKRTNRVVNKVKQPVIIGDHCWIAQGVMFLKSACIPNNTIIGANSLITKQFEEENTVIAGNPAKIIRRDVEWSPETPHAYIHTKKGK